MKSPFTSSSLLGLTVIQSPDRARYVLPAEVLPGVPWPPGFRDDINHWSASFLGVWNPVPAGQFLCVGAHTLLVRPQDMWLLRGRAG